MYIAINSYIFLYNRLANWSYDNIESEIMKFRPYILLLQPLLLRSCKLSEVIQPNEESYFVKFSLYQNERV